MQATSIDTALNKSYWTALLLTGNSSRAEAAVTEAMDHALPGQDWSRSLFQETVAASIRQPAMPFQDPPADVFESLPEELRQVLFLPRHLRRCYVLRILAGWPRQVCAALLDLDLPTVDASLADALRTLASLRFVEAEA